MRIKDYFKTMFYLVRYPVSRFFFTRARYPTNLIPGPSLFRNPDGVNRKAGCMSPPPPQRECLKRLEELTRLKKSVHGGGGVGGSHPAEPFSR